MPRRNTPRYLPKAREDKVAGPEAVTVGFPRRHGLLVSPRMRSHSSGLTCCTWYGITPSMRQTSRIRPNRAVPRLRRRLSQSPSRPPVHYLVRAASSAPSLAPQPRRLVPHSWRLTVDCEVAIEPCPPSEEAACVWQSQRLGGGGGNAALMWRIAGNASGGKCQRAARLSISAPLGRV